MKKVLALALSLAILAFGVEAKTTKRTSRTTSRTSSAAVTKGATHKYGDYLTTQEFKLKKGKNEYSVEYPVSGNPQLVNAMRDYIKECLFPKFKGSLATPDALLKGAVANVERDSQEEVELKVIYSSDYAVTLSGYSDVYWKGAAHGTYAVLGATFLVTDGTVFDIDMLPSFNAWEEKIKQGLADFFEVRIRDLSDYLFDINDLSYPGTAYLTDKGILLQYQPYEIAAWAMGAPASVIPATSANISALSAEGRAFFGK